MALSKEAALRKDRAQPSGIAMQHRHFAVIAEIISDMPHGEKIRSQVARHFALSLRRTNDRFDMDRFIAACDVNEED